MSYNSQREPGKEHIPRYTPGFIVLRILQLFVAIILVGLNAYSVAVLPWAGDIIMLFTSLCTVIICIWLTCAHSCAPGAFNYWATLVFDIWLYIWWLISLGLLAAETALYFAAGLYYCSYDSDDFDFNSDDDFSFNDSDSDCYYTDLYGDALTYASIKAAAAGLAGFMFLLFFISLVINSVCIHKHRKAGLHSRKTRFGGASGGPPVQYQMQYQNKLAPSTYTAVPQQGVPFNQQDTAYNPQGPYNQQPAPVQYAPQGFYGQQPQQALAPQHTGASYPAQPGSTSPAHSQSPYQAPPAGAPYQPPQGFPPQQQPQPGFQQTPNPY